MSRLIEALQKYSAQLNLFSVGDRLKLADKHIPDSLALLDFWQPHDGDSVADIGTGGGLPGLALAEARADVAFTLIDSTGKKIEAIESMVRELDMKNVVTLLGRFEDLAHEPPYREQFDCVTARAVAELPTLLEYASGFLKVGGKFYAWKSADYLAELETSTKAQNILGLEFVHVHKYSLPSGENRCILEFGKTKRLSEKYPRRVSLPKLKPLL